MIGFPKGSYVVSYLRHSPGDMQTISSQESEVIERCKTEGLIVVRIFKDEAKSGTTTAGRHAFLQMVDMLDNDLIVPRPAGVVLWSFSRFARDYDDAQYYCSAIRRVGYEIASITDQIPVGRIGRIVESLHHWKNEEVARQIGEDAKRGLHAIAKDKFWHGAKPPRGYVTGENVLIEMRKNGTPHYGRHLVFDPDFQPRVQKAWSMKLNGARNWDIHKETKLYDAINTYTTFFSNITYAGVLKCGDMRVLDAHPAYIALADWEMVQKAKRLTATNPKAPDGDPNHSRRAQSPFIMSGILYCGICGAAMSGQRYGGAMYYKCSRKHRSGVNACSSHSIVAWYINDLMYEWLAGNVFTLDRLRANRDAINAHIGGDHTVMQSRKEEIEKTLVDIDERVKRLLDSIEKLGLTKEIEVRMSERQMQARELERELAEINARLNQSRVELTDDALQVVVQSMREELQEEEPERVRALLRQVVVRAELKENEMTVWYVSPLLDKPKTVIATVPSRKSRLIEGVEIGTFSVPPCPTGAASPIYRK